MTFCARLFTWLLPAMLGLGSLWIQAQPGIDSAPDPGWAPPPLPGTRTAADTFRELLAMEPSERAAALASRSEYQRTHLEQKLREYEALPEAEREARLKELELRSHLLSLMHMAPPNRAHRLSFVPAEMRPVIDERLKQWDLLPPKLQKEALDHETSVNYLLRARGERVAPTGLLPEPPRENSAPPQTASELRLRKLLSLSPGQRRKVAEHVNQFLALSSNARQSTLEVFSPTERQAMERTLEAFEKLPLEQRQICIASFERLSGMGQQERSRFLKNAERWRAMSPRERETWRTLVAIIPPAGSTPPPPPLPGEFGSRFGPEDSSNVLALPGSQAASVSTN
jgi:hypothetical protein